MPSRETVQLLKAFELAQNREKLNEVGNECLKDGLLATALEAFTLSQNEMMIEFIRENFVAARQ